MNIPNIEANGHIYKDFSFFTKGGMGEIYRGIESDTNKPIIRDCEDVSVNSVGCGKKF